MARINGEALKTTEPSNPSLHRAEPLHVPLHEQPAVLTEEWPRIRARLERMLRPLRLSAHDIEDITQEVFIRLARSGRRYTVDHLTNTARVAAWRLGLNALRNGRLRAELLADYPEVADRWGLDEELQLAQMFERLAATLAALPTKERQAFVRDWLGEPVAPAARNRHGVSLFRARQKLRTALEGLMAGLPAWRLRRWVDGWTTSAAAVGTSLVIAAVVVSAPAGRHHVTAELTVTGARPATQMSSPPVETVSVTRSDVQQRSPFRVTKAADTPVTRGADQGLRDERLVAVPGPDGGDAVVVTTSDDPHRRALACTGTDGLWPVGNFCIDHPLR